MLVTVADYGNIGCRKTCNVSKFFGKEIISEKFEIFRAFQTMNQEYV